MLELLKMLITKNGGTYNQYDNTEIELLRRLCDTKNIEYTKYDKVEDLRNKVYPVIVESSGGSSGGSTGGGDAGPSQVIIMDEVVDPNSWLLELDLSANGSYYLIAMDNFDPSLKLYFGNSTFTSDGVTVGKSVKLDPELYGAINIEEASCGIPETPSYIQFQPSTYIYDGILVVVKDNSVEIIASKNNSMPT